MRSLLAFVQDWNFLIPLLLWFSKETYVRLKVRGRRVRTWGIRRDRSVSLIIDQQRTGGNYLTGDLGPLAEARTTQKLTDHFRSIGLQPAALEMRQFERGRAGNLVIGSVLRQGDCLARVALARLGYTVSEDGEKYTIGGNELTLELKLAGSRVSVHSEHSIFVRAPNPDDNSHTLIVIAALTANGLESTVDALIRRSPALALPKRKPAGFILTTSVETRDAEVRSLTVPSGTPRILR